MWEEGVTMHSADNQQTRVFFDWKVFGKKERGDKCVCWVGGEQHEGGGGGEEEEVDGEVGKDKMCLRESYIIRSNLVQSSASR